MKKFLLRIGFLILSLIVLNNVIVWIYEIPMRKAIKEGTYKRLHKWQDIQADSNEFDVLIFGSSRGYCAYNPVVIDSIAHTQSYNMCTGAQNIVETYYYLKEVLRFQKPKIIIYETFLPSFLHAPDHFNVFTNAKFMSSAGKKEMILGEFKAQTVWNFLFPIIKYKYLLRKQILVSARSNKNDADVNPRWIKGYLYSEKVVGETAIREFDALSNFDNISISTENMAHYLDLIQELCRENDIKLIAVRTPYPPSRIAISPKDSVHSYFENFYHNRDIPFYDFNYDSKEKYLDSDFTDYHHMNYVGANKVSKELAGILVELEIERKK